MGGVLSAVRAAGPRAVCGSDAAGAPAKAIIRITGAPTGNPHWFPPWTRTCLDGPEPAVLFGDLALRGRAGEDG